jgi:hypothetical protein
MLLPEVRRNIEELKSKNWSEESLLAVKESFLKNQDFLDNSIKELLKQSQGELFVDEYAVINHEIKLKANGKLAGRIKLNLKNKKEVERLKDKGVWIINACWNIENDLLLDLIWGFEVDGGVRLILNRALKNKKKNPEITFSQYETLFKRKKVILFYRTRVLKEDYNKKIWEWLNHLQIV